MNLKTILSYYSLVLALIFVIPSTAFGQWIWSAQDGNYSDPATWSCNCVPSSTDSVKIYDHTVYMDTDIHVNGGIFQVGCCIPTNWLIDQNNEYDIIVNGGTFINNGNVVCQKIELDSGVFFNSGNMTLDSLITKDSTWNSAGIINTHYLSHSHSDSGDDLFWNSNSELYIHGDFFNSGNFTNDGIIKVDNNFENCNYPSNKAVFENNYEVCVQGDFLNCGPGNSTMQGDSLTGNGGKFFLNGNSTNDGTITGDLIIYSSGGINIQNGFIDNTDILYYGAVASCFIGIAENPNSQIKVYPNPFTNSFSIETDPSDFVSSVEIYNMLGQLVHSISNVNSQQILITELDYLEHGLYTVRLQTVSGFEQQVLLIKE
jgi:hypothetical protein